MPQKNGDVAEVKRLVAAGANPNAAEDGGLTALYYAELKGYAEAAKVLLSAGERMKTGGDSVSALNFCGNSARICEKPRKIKGGRQTVGFAKDFVG